MAHKVIVVEDEDFTRAMVAATLAARGFEICLQTPSAREALKFASENPLDVAILDLHLGKGPTGLDLAIALRKRSPQIGIVILTSYEDPRMLQVNPPDLPASCIYVTKREIKDTEGLVAAVRRSAFEATSSKSTSNPTRKSSLGALTSGQLELLRLMANGLSNAEIAKRRFVTEKSVELAITRLVRAIGLERNPSHNQRVHLAKVYFNAMGLNIADNE